jgi:hypothetical protein
MVSFPELRDLCDDFNLAIPVIGISNYNFIKISLPVHQVDAVAIDQSQYTDGMSRFHLIQKMCFTLYSGRVEKLHNGVFNQVFFR